MPGDFGPDYSGGINQLTIYNEALGHLGVEHDVLAELRIHRQVHLVDGRAKFPCRPEVGGGRQLRSERSGRGRRVRGHGGLRSHRGRCSGGSGRLGLAVRAAERR